jgi:hypothetical protein
LRGGNGGGGRQDHILNHFEHAIDILQDIVVPKSQDAVAFGFQESRSACVSRNLPSVLSAIQLDYELETMTHKINNVATEMHLPAKVRV